MQVPFRARGVHRDVQARIVELFEGSDRITPGGGADEVRSEENLAELFGIERCHFHGIVKQWRKQLVSRRTADERASIKKALKQFLRDKAGEVISLRELEALRRRTGLTRNELVQRLGFSKNDLLESLQVPLLDEEGGGGGVGGAGDDADGAFSSSNLPAEDQVLIRLFNEAEQKRKKIRESRKQKRKRKKKRRRERKLQRKEKAAAEGRAVGWGGNSAAYWRTRNAMAGMLPAFLVNAVVALRRAAGFVDSGTGERGEYAMDKNTRNAADAAEQDGWEDDDDDDDDDDDNDEDNDEDDDDDDEDDDADAGVDAGVDANADVEDAGAEGDTEQDRLRALQRVAAWADEDQLMPLTSGGKSAAAMEAEVFVRSLLERHGGGQGGTGYDNGLVAGVDFWTEEHLKEGFAKTTRGEPVDPELVLVINSLMFQYRRAPPRRPAATGGGAGGEVKRQPGRARRPKGVSRRQWRRMAEDEQYETAEEGGSPTPGKEGQASQEAAQVQAQAQAQAQAQTHAQTPAKPKRPRGVSRREWRDMTDERRCALVEANRKDDSQLTWGIATPDIIFRQPVLLREPGGEEGGRVGEGKGASSSSGRLVRFIEVKNT